MGKYKMSYYLYLMIEAELLMATKFNAILFNLPGVMYVIAKRGRWRIEGRERKKGFVDSRFIHILHKESQASIETQNLGSSSFVWRCNVLCNSSLNSSFVSDFKFLPLLIPLKKIQLWNITTRYINPLKEI